MSAHALTITGRLSGETIHLPNPNAPPMPALVPPGVILNGKGAETFGTIDPSRGYPDVRSFRRKFALIVPATNTTMEHELWSTVVRNQGQGGLSGVGLHTASVSTPNAQLTGAADLLAYKVQFLAGLQAALDQAMMAQPQYLIMGMSLEHVIAGIEEIRASVAEIKAASGLSWATWHDAAPAALQAVGARRIGLLTPFDQVGNDNATRMFQELGFDVVASVGFSCANALHIAHVPDWAKEKAITELLATPANKLDAIVQCGTNMGLMDVAERLEPVIGLPILGINAVLLWYALRENGFTGPQHGSGLLLREH